MLLAESLSGIKKYRSGLLVAKASDYIGAARGTLSSVSDATSISGTVVKDTQTLSVPTTFTGTTAVSRYSSASDTIVIPKTALTFFDTGLYYNVYASYKLVGEPPTNSICGRYWYFYDYNKPNIGIVYGYDSSAQAAAFIWRDIYPNYRVGSFGLFNPTTSYTNFKIRAWGTTGGTVEIYIDQIYFIPYADNTSPNFTSSDLINRSLASHLPLVLNSNGTLFTDKDNNSTSAPWLGKFSVLNQNNVYGTGWNNCVIDMQESNDEVSSYNVTENGGGWTSQKYSFLIAANVGNEYIEPHTLATDNFSNTDITSGSTKYSDTTTGNLLWEKSATTISGFPVFWSNSGGKCSVPVAANQSFGSPNDMTRADMWLGLVDFASGVESSTDPSIRRGLLNEFMSCIQKVKFSIDTNTDGPFFSLGLCTTTAVGGSTLKHDVFAIAKLDSSGNIDFELQSYSWNHNNTYKRKQFGSTSNNIITGYSGQEIYVKVEKRGYYWRAKIWDASGSEPSTWTIDGHEPLPYKNQASTVTDWVNYPWDDNWNDGNADKDNIYQHFPITYLDYPHLMTGSLTTTNGAFATSVDDYELSYDPGSGTPGGMTFGVEKYDETQRDTIYVPYGPQRVIDVGSRQHRWNAGANGYNVRMVKDSGCPPLQAAGAPDMYENRRTGAPINLSRIRYRSYLPGDA